MPLPGKWVRQSIVLILLLGAFLILLTGVGRHPYSSLSLNIYHDINQKETLVHSQIVEADQIITLIYTHSSDGTPVQQIFTVSDSKALDLLEERYRWYGAGLEFGSGFDISYKDGWVYVTGYDRSFNPLPIRVALTVSQVLVINSVEIHLSDLAPAGSRLLIKLE